MNRVFAKLGEEQWKQLLQMHRSTKHGQGTGRSIQRQEELDWKGRQGWLVKLESQGRVCACGVVSQGWLAWISYSAMLESIKPQGHGFLSLIKLFRGTMAPSRISVTARNGAGSPAYCSEPSLEQTVPILLRMLLLCSCSPLIFIQRN